MYINRVVEQKKKKNVLSFSGQNVNFETNVSFSSVTLVYNIHNNIYYMLI